MIDTKTRATGGQVWDPYEKVEGVNSDTKKNPILSILIFVGFAIIAAISLTMILRNGFGEFTSSFTGSEAVLTRIPPANMIWAVALLISMVPVLFKVFRLFGVDENSAAGCALMLAAFTFVGILLFSVVSQANRASSVTEWLDNDLKTNLTYSVLFESDGNVTALNELNEVLIFEKNIELNHTTIKVTKSE